VFKPFILVIVV